ncbi:hydrogenase small subunit [Thiorhodococcus minor]|uniref:hydrogenase (acceptor) n=1 Tax=Thiorhodococcus minor TaxID=57489 RepID=A0A6M0JYE0_9GAMM|nr:hydrogenase small subunit [Thiorhodococcus minor]NEV62520.1 hydrogenase small subunit [Thiorhodococcus minor]
MHVRKTSCKTPLRSIGDSLSARGVSRRSFLKLCTTMASLLALPTSAVPRIAAALEQAKRPSVIWLSFQECTGCTESLTRSHAHPLEDLILHLISLDYHHKLQAASGEAAEEARLAAMEDNAGNYLAIVDGAVPGPSANPGFSTVAGHSNDQRLLETVADAAGVIAVGTCAAFGGLPQASPNPTGACAVMDLVTDKPVVNLPGCPPIPAVITGALVHYLAYGAFPELDDEGRPIAFYGDSIHDHCNRREHFDRRRFANSFDDEGAKAGWCLCKLGCRGPTTHNACATLQWNDGTSWPVGSGHPCLGCSEPGFWDRDRFYVSRGGCARR